jgi:hypothetical protein
MKTRRAPTIGAVPLLGLLFLVGLTLAVLSDPRSDSSELWSDISKAGVAIAFTTVAGVIATGALKLTDHRRTRDQERRKVFHDVVEAYNEAKSARRGLSAMGLLKPKPHRLRSDRAQCAHQVVDLAGGDAVR